MSQVRELRERCGLTQQQLADAAHVSRTLINFVEGGYRPSRHPYRAAIAGALGVDEADLFPAPDDH